MDEIVLAIIYGSHDRGGDIDVAIIQREAPAGAGIQLGDLDLYLLGEEQFSHQLAKLDPMVTEPILTGNLLLGDPHVWNEIRESTRDAKASEAAAVHCARRSAEELVNADRMATAWEAEPKGTHAHWLLETLSYSISYLSFARWYQNPHHHSITLRELAERNALLEPAFWRYRAKAKRADVPIAEVREWLRLWMLRKSPERLGG